ncbi:phage antirepressor KilAC domain-containing protein (plasmid) [Photobacterium ganghwense]|nr:phage antirepressor KilAC domain-containing protein [Photobacterium ganghwense]
MPSWYSRLSPETRMVIEDMDRQLAEKERQLQLVQPKVDFAEQVSIAPDAITVGEAAKLCGTGRTRLFAFLRQLKWLTRHNEPYQAIIESGYMDVKISQFEHPTQGLKNSITPLVTGKGLLKLQTKLKEGRLNG